MEQYQQHKDYVTEVIISVSLEQGCRYKSMTTLEDIIRELDGDLSGTLSKYMHVINSFPCENLEKTFKEILGRDITFLDEIIIAHYIYETNDIATLAKDYGTFGDDVNIMITIKRMVSSQVVTLRSMCYKQFLASHITREDYILYCMMEAMAMIMFKAYLILRKPS